MKSQRAYSPHDNSCFSSATARTTSSRLYAKGRQKQKKQPKNKKSSSGSGGAKNKKKSSSSSSPPKQRPKLIVFDLDGCLWKPELFELMSPADRSIDKINDKNTFDGSSSSFFSLNPKEQPLPGTTLTTPTYQRLELLGATRSILHDLCYKEEWLGTLVGISSRTDRPDWAYEAMEKFVLYQQDGRKTNDMPPIAMQDVFTPQLCVLDRNRNKADQFETLQDDSKHFASGGSKIRFRDMLFFDNEAGNCKQVAALGVTTVYCPQGVTHSVWEEGIQNFPTSSGKVLGQKMPY